MTAEDTRNPTPPREEPPTDWAKLYDSTRPRRHWMVYSEWVFRLVKLPFFAVLFLLDVSLDWLLARRARREKLQAWRQKQAEKNKPQQ